MKSFIVIFIILVIASCSPSSKKTNQVKIVSGEKKSSDSIVNIDVDISNIKEIDIDHFLKDVNYIPLETNKNSIIGEISKILFFQKKFYILDKITNSIFVFDENGAFNQKISRRGNGPGEFNKISDFNIDENSSQVVILSDLPQKVLRYSLSCQFIDEFKTPCYTRFFALLPGPAYAFYLEYGNNSNRLDREHNIIISDNKGGIIRGFQPYNSETLSNAFFKSKFHFYKQNDKVCYYPDLSDTIYEVKKDAIIPIYTFNFKEKEFDDKILKQRIAEQDKYYKSTKYCYFYSIFETPQVLQFLLTYDFVIYKGFYSKKTKKVQFGAIIKTEKYLLGNIIGCYSDMLIGELDQMTRLLVKNRLSQSLPKVEKSVQYVLQNSKDSDNPILVTYRLDY